MEAMIPSRFICPNSICHDFDPEEIECLRYTGRLVRSSLSRAKRSSRSPHAMLLRQRQIESAFNEQLIRHDLHSAGLRYDRRAVAVVNSGLAMAVTQSTEAIHDQSHLSSDQIERQKAKFAAIEVAKRQEGEQILNNLRTELSKKFKETQQMESEANELKSYSAKTAARTNAWERYQEWIRLNEEQSALLERVSELEGRIERAPQPREESSARGNRLSFWNPENSWQPRRPGRFNI
jgi:hypothetical protein